MVRAQDPSHYYLVHFPCCGQHYRAKHFWVTISKADGSGWLEILKMEMVQGVGSELKVWHKAKIVVKGNEIRVSVDGRPGPVVSDDTYKSGYIGLESWTYDKSGSSSFRNIKIQGKAVRARPWNESLQPPKNWFHPYATGKGQQSNSGIARAPNGDLLMALSPGGLVRSTDNGRTWELVPDTNWELDTDVFNGNNGMPLTTRDGRLIRVVVHDSNIFMADSKDNGKTWAQIQDRGQITLPEGVEKLHPSLNPLIELEDGTLVLFVYGGHASKSGKSILEWGTVHCVAYAMRSTDGGLTWAGPMTLDGPPAMMNLDLTEPYGVQVSDGRLLCLIRPIYSPWMWETWSEDGGATWGPTTRGPFSAYACAMLPHPTASGALVIGGRMPGLGLHVSYDNGITWKHHYRIGTDIWAMGAMYEVEPDVILYVYMDTWYSDMRAQFIRVTPQGLKPLIRKEFLRLQAK